MYDPSFLEQDASIAAVALLGTIISSTVDGHTVSVKLTEVEAYGGSDDPASHAYRTRTMRNEPMYGPAGTIYIYRSYGIHWCINLVTGAQDDPQAVLLRGGEVVDGVRTAMNRRGRHDHLTDGPGKLGQALGVTGRLSGSMLGADTLSIIYHPASEPAYTTTPRIGVRNGVDALKRFVVMHE
ncbi:MAG: DNA-3-methyladenine glycosylase [Actinomycetota bacterium]|nr:DNA-3-methyladenine glycosylase [Actinomycetota bacterium]MDK1016114.1 DNA-3-methyladenine glycosylase [Actinomycetota bacterium]MDK1025723.1 DNA-3-methyladenine glycosylase [Actinomycetota bacterium]MDK1037619.1 DNA-3-methyladenine glycosylase [Actinomycetota bacterium]MDK1095678.1 DNA-3-methyladenine glycosylase [Actinomycetota bacterium]